jgi:hypothetical protein
MVNGGPGTRTQRAFTPDGFQDRCNSHSANPPTEATGFEPVSRFPDRRVSNAVHLTSLPRFQTRRFGLEPKPPRFGVWAQYILLTTSMGAGRLELPRLAALASKTSTSTISSDPQ